MAIPPLPHGLSLLQLVSSDLSSDLTYIPLFLTLTLPISPFKIGFFTSADSALRKLTATNPLPPEGHSIFLPDNLLSFTEASTVVETRTLVASFCYIEYNAVGKT